MPRGWFFFIKTWITWWGQFCTVCVPVCVRQWLSVLTVFMLVHACFCRIVHGMTYLETMFRQQMKLWIHFVSKIYKISNIVFVLFYFPSTFMFFCLFSVPSSAVFLSPLLLHPFWPLSSTSCWSSCSLRRGLAKGEPGWPSWGRTSVCSSETSRWASDWARCPACPLRRSTWAQRGTARNGIHTSTHMHVKDILWLWKLQRSVRS